MRVSLSDHSSSRISHEIKSSHCYRELLKVNPLPFIVKLLILALWMTCSVWLAYTPGWYWAGAILLGVGYAHAVELVHSCVHCTATGHRTVDRIFGSILGFPMLLSFHAYVDGHLRHHRFVGTKDDFESFSYSYQDFISPGRTRRLAGVFMHFSMVRHFWNAFRRIWMAVKGELGEHIRSQRPGMTNAVIGRVVSEHRAWLVLIGAMIVTSIVCSSGMLVWLWLIPVFCVAAPTHAFIELPEHFLTDYPSADIRDNTRQIVTNRVMEYFTNFNNLHGLHHLDGRIQMEKLKGLERMLDESDEFKYCDPGYISFAWKVAKTVWQGKNYMVPGNLDSPRRNASLSIIESK